MNPNALVLRELCTSVICKVFYGRVLYAHKQKASPGSFQGFAA